MSSTSLKVKTGHSHQHESGKTLSPSTSMRIKPFTSTSMGVQASTPSSMRVKESTFTSMGIKT
ncbi:Uncharacterized protein DAT39_016097 [Clarias magur]|uniref:Uncharacterized protein n=1 Tax=Clarias magur TaxID=1594786 RepID=A0A8J4WX73_CLAMG|nr:Uncharacterized protein DAT39_016097 [Clarias magur]